MLKRRGVAAIGVLLLTVFLTVAQAATTGGGKCAAGENAKIGRQEAQDFLLLLNNKYCQKNHAGFMNLVSTKFSGDDFVLANAVRRDFQLLSQMNISFTVMGVTSIIDFAVISVNYRRTVVPLATGQTMNDSGITELVLVRENGQLKLLSMKTPLLFGLANSSVATGAVVSGQNQRVIQIAKDGTVYIGPVE